MTNAFDTNVIVYSLDAGEMVKQPQAIALLSSFSSVAEPPVLLWQVACECLNWLRKKQSAGLLTDSEVIKEYRHILGGFRLVLPTPRLLTEALTLHTRYSLSHWDSLLIAACIDAGVETLYSEDMSHETTYDSVRVVNPFVAS